MHTSIKYLISTVFCSGFVIQCQGCTSAGWLWEGGGLGDHQPGVYVPLKALFLVLYINENKIHFSVPVGVTPSRFYLNSW